MSRSVSSHASGLSGAGKAALQSKLREREKQQKHENDPRGDSVNAKEKLGLRDSQLSRSSQCSRLSMGKADRRKEALKNVLLKKLLAKYGHRVRTLIAQTSKRLHSDALLRPFLMLMLQITPAKKAHQVIVEEIERCVDETSSLSTKDIEKMEENIAAKVNVSIPGKKRKPSRRQSGQQEGSRQEQNENTAPQRSEDGGDNQDAFSEYVRRNSVDPAEEAAKEQAELLVDGVRTANEMYGAYSRTKSAMESSQTKPLNIPHTKIVGSKVYKVKGSDPFEATASTVLGENDGEWALMDQLEQKKVEKEKAEKREKQRRCKEEFRKEMEKEVCIFKDNFMLLLDLLFF